MNMYFDKNIMNLEIRLEELERRAYIEGNVKLSQLYGFCLDDLYEKIKAEALIED